MNDINPYQSPREFSGKRVPGVGIWRKGEYLVVHRDTRIPNICLKTGAVADRRIRKEVHWVTWNDDGDYTIELPVTNAWWRRRTWLSWICGVLAVVLTAAMMLPAFLGSNPQAGGSLAMYLSYSVYLSAFVLVCCASKFTTFVEVKKPTATHYYLKHVHPDVLLRFPEWPG